MVKYHEMRISFYDKLYVTHRHNYEFRLCWFPEEAGYSAEKGYTDVNLPLLMSNENKNISGSLSLDLRKWWRDVQGKNLSDRISNGAGVAHISF